jgi:hypothetical protein
VLQVQRQVARGVDEHEEPYAGRQQGVESREPVELQVQPQVPARCPRHVRPRRRPRASPTASRRRRGRRRRPRPVPRSGPRTHRRAGRWGPRGGRGAGAAARVASSHRFIPPLVAGRSPALYCRERQVNPGSPFRPSGPAALPSGPWDKGNRVRTRKDGGQLQAFDRLRGLRDVKPNRREGGPSWRLSTSRRRAVSCAGMPPCSSPLSPIPRHHIPGPGDGHGIGFSLVWLLRRS